MSYVLKTNMHIPDANGMYAVTKKSRISGCSVSNSFLVDILDESKSSSKDY